MMPRLSLVSLSAVALVGLVFAAPAARAQGIAGAPGSGTNFRDTSILTKAEAALPPGHKVVLIEFEDLECPACAHAAPIVKTAIEHYKIQFERHDFLIQSHFWSKDAASIARYLEDKVSPEKAEDYRRDVFAAQTQIASRDDLQNFTKHWFDQHHLQMPFVIDPTGRFGLEVQQDVHLGERLGLGHTPTIIVVGPKGWIEVTDVSQLYTAIETVLKQQPAATATAHNTMKKPVSSNQH
jgi:protein-disulfide isomerase